MISGVRFIKDYRCFKEGDEFSFLEGVNLLVGDQGCGKSTILDLLTGRITEKVIEMEGEGNFAALDFEKDNPRTKDHFDGQVSVMPQVLIRWISHGECNLKLLRDVPDREILVLDEPDQALSIRSCLRLVKIMKSRKQVLAAVHSPVIISAFDSVYSLEHRKAMHPMEFFELSGWHWAPITQGG